MTFKSIEIHYDIDRIPGIAGETAGRGLPWKTETDEALAFRNDAIELIEDAFLAAEAGEWESAEIGRGEVSFSFAVDDFAQAEAIVHTTVAGTRFACIRQILRKEFDLAALAC